MKKFLSIVLAVIVMATVVSVPANAADTVIHTNTSVTTNTTTESPVNLRDSVTVVPPVITVEDRGNGVTIETTVEKTITVSNKVKTTVEKITTKTVTVSQQQSCPEGTRPQTTIMQKANNKLESIKKYAADRDWNTIIQSTTTARDKVVYKLRFTGRSGYLDIVQTTTCKDGKYKTCYTWADQAITLDGLKNSLEMFK